MQTASKRKFIDAYMWMFGVTKRQALIEWQLSGEGYRMAIIEVWEDQCKKAFEND